jgi:predicted permease
LLFAAAGLVLLLACANVANLLLVQLSGRMREVATRCAVGASVARLVRQFLTESLLISFTGGLAGLALAWWGTRELIQFAAPRVARIGDAGMNWPVFAFSAVVCVMTGVLFGLAPAVAAMRVDPQSILNEASRSTMSAGQRRLRDGLVIVEVSLAFVLAIGATVLVRELVRLKNTEVGFVPQNVMTIHIGQPLAQAGDGRQFYEIASRVRQIPGVREAGFTQIVPLQDSGWRANSIDFRRGVPREQVQIYQIELRYVTPGYFRALGIPILRGRGLTDRDIRGTMPVIVINEALARKEFGSMDAIGQQTSRGTIVGIAADVRELDVSRAAAPEIYYPIAQNWSQLGELGMTLIVKTDGSPLATVGAVRAAIREVNPGTAMFSIKTMDRVIRDSLSDFILYLALMSAFAGIALLLACSGTYGVISFLAASRNREFAVRAALGAEQSQVTRLVLRDAVRLTAAGLALGLIFVILMRPLLSNLPTNVGGPDAIMVIVVALAIAALTLTACIVPARRASASDPMAALRNE